MAYQNQKKGPYKDVVKKGRKGIWGAFNDAVEDMDVYQCPVL